MKYLIVGPLAQWSEQRTHNPLVPGSNPGGAINLSIGTNEVRKVMSGRAKGWGIILVLMLLLPGAPAVFAKKKKLPDLIVAHLSSDTAAIVGTPLQNVSTEILNQGKKPAGAFRLHYYLSLDRTITPQDFDTGATCEIAGLARDEVGSCTTSIDLPASLVPGIYYLGVIVDDQEAVSE